MSDFYTTRGRAYSWADSTVIVMTAILAPQIILRSLSFNENSLGIRLACLAVAMASAVVLIGVAGLSRVSPRRLSYQLVASHLGAGMGVVAASARFLCYLLLIVVGAGLTYGGAQGFYSFSEYIRWFLVGIIVLLALPVLGGLPLSKRLVFFSTVLGATAVTVVVVSALVKEMTGGINQNVAEVARRSMDNFGATTGADFSVLSGVVAALFTPAVCILISERVFAKGTDRRLNTKWVRRSMVGSTIVIVLTLSLSAIFNLPGQRLGVPTLFMGYAMFGHPGEMIIGLAYICTGVCVVLLSYERLFLLLRELSSNGILPRTLGTRDALKPRLTIVGVAAVCAALLSSVLLSTQAGAIIFIVAAFAYFGLACAAAVVRSTATLKESVDKAERNRAVHVRLVFSVVGIFCLLVLGLVLVTSPRLLLIALVGLAIPALVMFKVRRSIGRVKEVLAPDLLAGRRLPTRVHGVVLIKALDDPALRALTYARAHRLSSLSAITVDYDSAKTSRLLKDWEKAGLPVDLTVLGTPQEATRGQIVDFVHALRTSHPGDVVTLFYPRVANGSAWGRFLLRAAVPKVVADLRYEPGVILAEVPYMIGNEADDE